MFLKTVPVVAVHSEWRSSKSLSLPLCFSDSTSDSEFASSTGTPIPRKVQMIIDSLRSTQSSDMSDDVPVETNTQSVLELPRHGGRKSCHMEVLTRSRRPEMDSGKHEASGSGASEGSDSDDSIDRGIEEAIQEYLKEKVDNKHKTDPVMSPAQTPKVQRGDVCMPDSPKPHAHSNKVITASSDAMKGSKAIQPLVDLKKKKSSKEIPFRKTKAVPSSGVRRDATSSSQRTDKTPIPHRANVKEELDSSSDDGIEEAIQKFQQEEKDRQENLKSTCQDSSSDDGIEEAIRHYQQEKEKEHKFDLKPSHLMATQCIRIRPLKKLAKKNNNNNRKKTVGEERKVKCALPRPVNLTLNESSTHYLKAKSESEQQIHPTFMVNTTAELMCAEAILDISKTVMPAAYKPTMNLDKSSPVETQSYLSTGVSLQTDEKSCESSVDSEDGIEQEIRKFLELKAKMHEQAMAPPSDCSALPLAAKSPPNKKVEEDQNKALRLSFSRKRKRKEEDGRSGKREVAGSLYEEPQLKNITYADDSVITSHTNSAVMLKHTKSKQTSPHLVTEGFTSRDRGSSCSSVSSSKPSRSVTGSKNDSSDKSSSLDSDEDLDAAIKDLLKTKKKVKKKVRDMKLKTQKSLKPTQLLSLEKKPKPVIDQKGVLAAKPLKGSKDCTDVTKQDKPKGLKSQQSSKKPKQGSETEQASGDQHVYKMETDSQPCILPGGVDEDNSSVDSDDSIEQEIRRFLAEKAKVSVVPIKQDDKGPESTLGETKIEEPQIDVSEALIGLCNADPLQEKTAAISATLPNQTDSDAVKSEEQSGCNFIVMDERTGGQSERTLHERRNNSSDSDKDRALRTGEVRDRNCSGPSVICLTGRQEPKCQAQHQNLFLMKPENCSISKASETSPVDLPSSLQNRSRLPLREVISTVCVSPAPTGKSPISSHLDTPTAARDDGAPLTDSFYQRSCLKRAQREQQSHPFRNIRHSFSNPSTLPPNPHLSCVPLPLALSQPHISASMTCLRRDPAAAMARPAIKNSHVQLRSIQEDTERVFEVKEEEQEKCINETDVESGEERGSEQQRAVKKPQQSSQFGFTCIDPGEIISPYITLNTEQRTKNVRLVNQRNRMLKSIKKKLQFVVSVSR